MRNALIAALLPALLAAPALAAPPAFDAKPRAAPQPAKPGTENRFDLRTAPQLDDLTVQPDPRPDAFRPEQKDRLCLDRRFLVGHPCSAPRKEPKLYLLSPDLQPYATAEPKE